MEVARPPSTWSTTVSCPGEAWQGAPAPVLSGLWILAWSVHGGQTAHTPPQGAVVTSPTHFTSTRNPKVHNCFSVEPEGAGWKQQE